MWRGRECHLSKRRPGWELWQKGHSEAGERPREEWGPPRVQKGWHGWAGNGVVPRPTARAHGRGWAPRGLVRAGGAVRTQHPCLGGPAGQGCVCGGGVERERTPGCRLRGGSGLTVPSPGLPPHFCFHPDTAALQGWGGTLSFSRTFPEDQEGASLAVKSKNANRPRPACSIPPHSCCQPKGGAVPRDSGSPGLPTWGRPEPSGTWRGEGGWGRWRGFPSCSSAQGWGQSRGNCPKVQKPASCSNPHPQCQTNKRNREKWKKGGGRQTKTEPPDLLPGAEDPADSGGLGPGLGGSSWAGTAPGPRSCPHRQRPRHPHCSGLWSGSPCWAASPPMGPRSCAAGWPGRHPPCPPQLGLWGLHSAEGSRRRHTYYWDLCAGETHTQTELHVCRGVCGCTRECPGAGQRVLGCMWTDAQTHTHTPGCTWGGWRITLGVGGNTVIHSGIYTGENTHTRVSSGRPHTGNWWGECTDIGEGRPTPGPAGHIYYTPGGIHNSPTPFFCCHSPLKERS